MSVFNTFTDWVTGKSKKSGGGGGGGGWGYANPKAEQMAADPVKSFQSGLVGTQVTNDPRFAQQLDGATNGKLGATTTTQPQYSSTQTQASTTDPIKQQIRDRFSALQNVFNGLFGGIDAKAQEKTGELNSQYDQQVSDLGKQYENAAKQSSYMMGARGIGSSSYNTDNQNALTDTYNTGLSDTMKSRDQSLSGLGNWVAQSKQGLDSQKNAYNDYMSKLDQYGASDLQQLYDTMGTGLQNAQSTATNYFTNPQNIAALSQIAPVQNNGGSQLASRLQALVTSSAPVFAKREIAKGLVKAANLTDGNAQSYWQNQFEDMLKNNGLA